MLALPFLMLVLTEVSMADIARRIIDSLL